MGRFGRVFARKFQNPKISQEDFMNKPTRSRWLGLVLILSLSACLTSALNAQQPAQPGQQSPSQAPGQQSQPPAQAPDQSRQQAPDSQAQSQQPQGQIFAGTVMKSGNKFVLQDASGTAYDVDRQDLLKKYEGQKVRINGTLDPDGKTIHVK
jgi:uncharacterized protein YdeI (BOF family)